jgi:hypothetical protein
MEKEWRDMKGVDGRREREKCSGKPHSAFNDGVCMSWLTGLLLMSLACLQQQLAAVAPPFSPPAMV